MYNEVQHCLGVDPGKQEVKATITCRNLFDMRQIPTMVDKQSTVCGMRFLSKIQG